MEMKKKYELMVIISSRITGSEIEKRLQGVKELLEEVTFEELWGTRPFAYPIKGHEQGYYAVWNFLMNPDDIETLEKALALFPDLVRSLILQVPENYVPMTLKDIEAGLEDLKKTKADKRSGNRMGGGDKRDDRKPAPAMKQAPLEKAPAAEKSPEAPAKEAAEPAKPAKPAKSFDQKLEDILSNDDLGL